MTSPYFGRAARQRWGMLLALGVLTLMVVQAAGKPPRIGLHGESPGLAMALAGLLVGAVSVRSALLVHRVPPRRYLPALGLLALSCAVLIWLQPAGPWVAVATGMTIILGARMLPVPYAAPLLALSGGLAIAALAYGTGGHGKGAGALDGLFPFAYLCVLAAQVWRYRAREERAQRTLVLMAETHQAELRAAALAERQRLAREMHDVLAHSLSGLVVHLEGARLLANSDPGDPRLAGLIDRAHQLARNGLDEARQAIGMLRDDELPSTVQLARLAEVFQADTGVSCRFSVAGAERELGPPVLLALYRVAQEGLTNVRKHAAQPDRAEVRLRYCRDTVSLAVQDFGASAPRPAPAGYGLTGMRERAALLGGTLTAAPTDAGFLVRLEVPA